MILPANSILKLWRFDGALAGQTLTPKYDSAASDWLTAYLPFDGNLNLYTPPNAVFFSRNPLRPGRSLDKIQPRESSAADVPLVYASLATDDLIELPLRLTTAERVALEFFFFNIARGRSNPFTYSDSAGISTTVKFNQAALAIKETAYNSHAVTVSLRVQP